MQASSWSTRERGNTVTTVPNDDAHVIPRLPALGFGGDWNPEQWPSQVWDEDLRLMREAHVNLVTLGVFSWAYLEPTPGQYEFGWLDTVLDKCLDAGIAVDLATATASPPPWLGHRWPESLPVTDDGVRLVYGARQQYCPSSAPYRDRALALTERMASRYADHDAVVMWHVGNEYGAHTPACWCDISAEAFRDWLAKRYDTLDELNAAWSTAFWSQRFSDWSEVIPPRRTPYFPNPTHQLDFKRFSSDALLELFKAERDIIRTHSPVDKPITTNFMRFFPHADYWDWARAEDVVSDDWYPDLADPLSHVEGAAGADLMRSLGDGQPWLLMEQAVSAINWRTVNPPKSGGAYRRWSLQQVARGADAVLHFQWRAAAGGAEKWHSAMLPHAGSAHALVARGRVARSRARVPAGGGGRAHGCRRGDRPRLVVVVGARARLASVHPAVDGGHPAHLVRAALASRLLDRLRPPRVRSHRLRPGRRAAAVLRHRPRSRADRRGRRARQHRRHRLLLRCRRRARPRAHRRLPGAVAGPPGHLGRGVPPAAARRHRRRPIDGAGPARLDHGHRLERARPPDDGGAGHVVRRRRHRRRPRGDAP